MLDNNTWQAIQWFDLEQSSNDALHQRALLLKGDNKVFDEHNTLELLNSYCPVSNVDITVLVNEFNECLQRIH